MSGGRDGGQVVLSSDVSELTVRPGLAEKVRLGLTNTSSRSRFIDVTITARSPVQPSKPGLTTYVPAGGTVHASVGVTAAVDGEPGTYDVVFASGRDARLGLPVTVVNPPNARYLPRDRMTATATSAQEPANAPAYAIDGIESTLWHTRYSPVRDPLPQSITLELGGTYDVAELVYLPRPTGSANGTVTAYTLYGSADGRTFTEIGRGTWAADRVRKTATVSGTGLRFVRLEATEGVGGYASAAEIVMYGKAT
jgi:hypothetical protein